MNDTRTHVVHVCLHVFVLNVYVCRCVWVFMQGRLGLWELSCCSKRFYQGSLPIAAAPELLDVDAWPLLYDESDLWEEVSDKKSREG